MIRKALVTDIPQLINLAVEALSIDAYEGMQISRLRVYESVKTCVSRGTNFCWVSVSKDGVILGCLGAEVAPNPFHEKSQAIVYMWYCKNPGDGKKLMKTFLAWCEERPSIMQIIYTGERGADPRVGKMALKLGFDNPLPLFVKTR